MDISRFLPYNEYQAAVNANAPTALNPFATIADLVLDGGIYGGSGSLEPGTTLVTMQADSVLRFDSPNGPVTGLFTIDAVNNRIGFGTSNPQHGLHFAVGNAFIQNGSLGVGEAPTTEIKGRFTYQDADDPGTAGEKGALRIDGSYTAPIGSNKSVYGISIRSTFTKTGTSNFTGVDVNYGVGGASAGVHEFVGIRTHMKAVQSGTASITNIGIKSHIYPATAGTHWLAQFTKDGVDVTGLVLQAQTADGKMDWVNPNTLITPPTTLYNADGIINVARTVASNNKLTFDFAAGTNTTDFYIDPILGVTSVTSSAGSTSATLSIFSNGNWGIDNLVGVNGDSSYIFGQSVGLVLGFTEGLGATEEGFVISNSGILARSQTSLTGMSYAANYSTNGIANFGARWIPDKGWVDSAISTAVGSYLPLAGGTMSGSIALGTNSITDGLFASVGFSSQNLDIIDGSVGYQFSMKTSLGQIGHYDGATAFWGIVDMHQITASRTWAMPDATGTIALIGGINNVSEFINDAGYLTALDGNGIYDGSGSLSGSTTVTQGINPLIFSATIPLASPGTWYETFRINATNNEPTAYLKGLYVSTTGANGHVGQFQNLTSNNNVLLSTPNNAIEATGTAYILGKDNLVSTNGLLVTNQNGYTGTWAFKNNGNVAQRHEVPLAGNGGWNYGYSLVSVNNCPTDYLAALNVAVSGSNSYGASFSNSTYTSNIELCAPGHAIFSRLGTKGLMVGVSGWGSVVNHPSYGFTGGQVFMGSDTAAIQTTGNGTTAGTYNLRLRNSALTDIMTLTDDGLLSVVKGGHTLVLNANGTSTLTEIQTTNIGYQVKSTDGYFRLGRTGSVGASLIYVGDAANSLQLSGATAGTVHMNIASDGKIGIGGTSTTSLVEVFSGDVETKTNTRGFIVLDRTNATRYRIYTDGGVLYTEPA